MLKRILFLYPVFALRMVSLFGANVVYRCEEYDCIENYTGSCCTVHNFGIIDNLFPVEENITKLLGKREDFTIENVDRIRIDQVVFVNFSADFLPRQIFSMNIRIRVLNITNGSLATIRRHEFQGAQKLNFLYLPNNRLSHLKANCFEGADNLYEINLSRNVIENVDENAFSGLSFLSTLDLSHNQITTIEVKTFANLGRLFNLNLAHNNIKELDPFTFYYCVKLDRLNLNHNRLVRLTITTPFNELRSLKVENNQIWNLTVLAGEVRQPRWMLRLHAANNLLWNLTTNFNVRELDLYSNNFMNISFLVHHASTLQFLSLGNNPLLVVNYKVINKLEKLKTLNLTDLGIHDFTDSSLNLPNLEKLDLSNNRLESVDNIILSENLYFLNLEDNPVVQKSSLYTIRKTFDKVKCIKVNREWDCVQDELKGEELSYESKILIYVTATCIGVLICFLCFTILKSKKTNLRTGEAGPTNASSVATELEVF